MNFSQKSGFSLVELMIVVAIIGILAAIAVPRFSEYRTRSYNSQTQSFLSGLAISQEAFFVDNVSYTSNATSLVQYGLEINANVTYLIDISTTEAAWSATAIHDQSNQMFVVGSYGGGVRRR